MIYFSQSFKKVRPHDLEEIISLNFMKISDCISVIYYRNFLNPTLLWWWKSPWKRSWLINPTYLQVIFAVSLEYNPRIISSFLSSFVIYVNSIFLMIKLSLCFSFAIYSFNKFSKDLKYFSTASLHAIIDSIWCCYSWSKWWLSCSTLIVSWFDTPFLCTPSIPFKQSIQILQLRSHFSSIPIKW